MSVMTRFRGLVASLALVPLLSGCLVVSALGMANGQAPVATGPSATSATSASGSSSASSASSSASSSSSTTSVTSATTPPAPAAPPALPAGTRWATFDDQQVRFAVASAWIEINPATMQTAATIPADVKALAKKLGLSATELVKRFDDVDLAYLAMPVGGYSTNLAILSANTGSLPDDEWVKETYSANGKLKILGIERMPTPVGDGMRISASGSVRSMSIAAATIIVDVGRDCVIFEIAGRKRADVDQAAATLLSTLHSI